MQDCDSHQQYEQSGDADGTAPLGHHPSVAHPPCGNAVSSTTHTGRNVGQSWGFLPQVIGDIVLHHFKLRNFLKRRVMNLDL